MEADIIKGLIGVIPGGGIASLAVWFALRKDAQCTALMGKLTELIEKQGDLALKQAVSTSEVRGVLDRILDAVRNGTRS